MKNTTDNKMNYKTMNKKQSNTKLSNFAKSFKKSEKYLNNDSILKMKNYHASYKNSTYLNGFSNKNRYKIQIFKSIDFLKSNYDKGFDSKRILELSYLYDYLTSTPAEALMIVKIRIYDNFQKSYVFETTSFTPLRSKDIKDGYKLNNNIVKRAICDIFGDFLPDFILRLGDEEDFFQYKNISHTSVINPKFNNNSYSVRLFHNAKKESNCYELILKRHNSARPSTKLIFANRANLVKTMQKTMNFIRF